MLKKSIDDGIIESNFVSKIGLNIKTPFSVRSRKRQLLFKAFIASLCQLPFL